MSDLSNQLTRRRFLQAASTAAAMVPLAGCRPRYFVLASGTLAPPPIQPADTLLTIDTHCHLFNGTDIQLKNFLDYTHQGLGQWLVDIVQEAEEKVGPRGVAELVDLALLAKLVKTPACPGCTETEAAPSALAPAHLQPAEARAHIRNMRKGAFEAAKKSVGTSRNNHRAPVTADEREADNQLKDALAARDHDEYNSGAEKRKAKQAARKVGTPPAKDNECGDPHSSIGNVETAFDYFMPRIVLAQIYLDTFCPSAGRNVDLMFSAMVDYDWWLAKGGSTLTSLQDQVKVMEQISILSGGRIHGFVPFCPLREVAHRAGHGSNGKEATWSSLDFVKDAVQNHGCIGVKMYPPMGFAPYGNADLDDPTAPPFSKADLAACSATPPPDVPATPKAHIDFWSRNSELPDWIINLHPIEYASDGSAERLGVRLDQALADLYSWCEAEGVPILAHTNTTNGIDCVYQNLATEHFWAPVLKAYPRLRVSFGHMGGFDDKLKKDPEEAHVPATTQAFMNLMDGAPALVDIPASGYAHAYGDSAFDAVLLGCHKQFAQRVQLAYGETNFRTNSSSARTGA